MARHFPNFLDAYVDWAKNDLVPDQFTLWTGLSLIAGALERKVWMTDGKMTTFPNLFVLLVGTPGSGKSQAISPGKSLMYELGLRTSGDFKIMEGIATQASVCERMEQTSIDKAGIYYSSMYYIGSEGSDSALKNHADDFRATACAMYDCEPVYQKSLKSKAYNIPNPVMNMIAGSTFDFLGSIVDQNSVMGGLASRFTYVIDEKELPANTSFGTEGTNRDPHIKQQLVDDLEAIYKLYGKLRYEKTVIDVYSQWWKTYRDEFSSIESERIRSLLVRKPLLLKKLLMLFSISERSDMGVRVEHIIQAIDTVETVTKNASRVITSSLIANRDSQSGINQVVLQKLKQLGGVGRIAELKRAIMNNGNDANRISSTLDSLVGAEMIKLDDKGNVTLLIDPDRNL